MKQLIVIVCVSVILLLAVILTNTLRYGTSMGFNEPQISVELQRKNIAVRLANATKIKTVSEQEVADIDYSTFVQLHNYIDEEFPLVKQHLSKETVADYSLLYIWQGSDETLAPVLLLSHMDVVPVVPGTESSWDHPPFGGEIADGFIWGRGTLDDKLSVFAILEGIEHLLLENYQPKRSYYLAFGHDEEIGGLQGASSIAELLGERNLKMLYVLDEGGTLISGEAFSVNKQLAIVNTSEKGYVALQLTAKSAGGHASAPEAETAVAIISQAVARVSDNKFPVHTEMLSSLGAVIADDLPILYRAILANLWLLKPLIEYFVEDDPLTNAMVRTTTAPTMLSGSPKENVLPIESTAVINHRIMPGETIETVKQFVIDVIDDDRVQVEVLAGAVNPSRVASTTGPEFRVISKTILQLVREDTVVVPAMLFGSTDTKHYTQLTDNAYRFVFAVNDGENRAHGTNERISVETYLDSIRFYIQLIKNTDEI